MSIAKATEVKEETPIVEESPKSKTIVNAQDLKEEIKGIERAIWPWAASVSLVEQTKGKDEKNQKEVVPSVDLFGENTET